MLKSKLEKSNSVSVANSLKKGLFVLLWLIIWQVAALVVNKPIFLPTPISTVRRLLEIVITGSFWQTIAFSFSRLLLGFFSGMVMGLLLAWWASKAKWFRAFLEPLIHFLKVVPIAAIIILILLWVRAKNLSILISFIMAMPIFYTNILEGFDSMDKKLSEMAYVFGVSTGKKLRYIAFPQLFPYLKSALKLSLSMSFKAGIAAEVIGIPDKSIGEMLYNSKIYIDADDLFAWTLTIILVSFALSKFAELILLLVRNALLNEKGNYSVREASKVTGVTLIKLVNLSKSYGDKVLFENLSMDISAGEFVQISHPSGWGKTTLLRIIMGLEESDTGAVLYSISDGRKTDSKKTNSRKNNGSEITDYSNENSNAEKKSQIRIATVFQSDALVPDLTALTNITFVTGARPSQVIEAASELGLSKAELDNKACYLSGGERRRVCILRAVLSPHALLLLDEPYAGLDGETRKLAEKFIEKHSVGITTILVDHKN